jgi:hypothetical protein
MEVILLEVQQQQRCGKRQASSSSTPTKMINPDDETPQKKTL